MSTKAALTEAQFSTKGAREGARQVASDDGVDSLRYRNADAYADALQDQYEWYAGLVEGET